MLHHAITIGVCALGLLQSTNAQAVDSLSVTELSKGQHIDVQTDELYFRFEIVDPVEGRMQGQMSKDGEQFGATAPVYLLGSTRGRQEGDGGITLVLMRELKVGLSMELGVFNLEDSNRWITTTVQAIRVSPPSSDQSSSAD